MSNIDPNAAQPQAQQNPPQSSTQTQNPVAGNSAKGDPNAKKPSLEEENVALKAEVLRWKNATNKATNQAADFKRKLNEKLSAQEQEDAARQEREDYYKGLERENAVMKQTSALMDRGFGRDEATKIAEARYDGDVETAINLENAHYDALEAARKKDYEDRLAKLTAPASGNGSGVDYQARYNQALADGDMVSAVRAIRESASVKQ